MTPDPIDIVADAIWAAFAEQVCVDRNLDRICDTGDHEFSMRRVAERVLESLRAASEITTDAELDALPIKSVVMTLTERGHTVYEKVADEDGAQWWTDGIHDPSFGANDLPALLLYAPRQR